MILSIDEAESPSLVYGCMCVLYVYKNMYMCMCLVFLAYVAEEMRQVQER
jgi:hypothetical protein